ncbi:MAG TPA: ATP-grasp domain-containing protein, partial [Opitutaceae bacterium]
GMTFEGASKPTVEEVMSRLGTSVVLKPNNEGSSVGLAIVSDEKGLRTALTEIKDGRWVAERKVEGREVSVGVLGGKAVGIVEIKPKSGVFDYKSKYTKGASEYVAPAPLEDAVAARVKTDAETAFSACGCRDFARIDFIISPLGEPFLLEINTLPGMKETSLLPMCARCAGLDFTALVREMVSPAVQRFHQRKGSRRP